MSVYKRKGKDTYSYDFVIRGQRFSGDTGETTKRAAERFETAKREAAKLEVADQASLYGPTLTFDLAAHRWWEEVGQRIEGFCLADQGPEDFDLCRPTAWQPLPAAPEIKERIE